MIRPTLATVLSGRSWEPRLVETARKTGRLRVVGRAYEPADIGRFGPVDCIALGSETSWLNPELLYAWKRRGHRIIGIHPAGDQPGAALFNEAAVDLVASEDCEPQELVHRISLLGYDPAPASSQTHVTAVTGVRGAPGRSTVAMSLGARLPSSVVVDADQVPGLVPMFNLAHSSQADTAMTVDISAGTSVKVRALPSWNGTWGKAVSGALLMSCRDGFDNVIVDDGLLDLSSSLLRSTDTIVLVADASVLGITRAAASLERWVLPQPKVVLNRVDDPAIVETCRYLLGLDPAWIIPRFSETRPHEVVALVASQFDPESWATCLGPAHEF